MTRPSHTSRRAPSPSEEWAGVAHGDPAEFLAAFPGEPRGFWGRADRWVAWVGQVARIEVRAGLGGSRFEAVRKEARRALAELADLEGALSPWPSPRFFGGFSFVDAEPDMPWRGFPSASFVLPRATLVGRDGSVRFHACGTPGVAPRPSAGGETASEMTPLRSDGGTAFGAVETVPVRERGAGAEPDRARWDEAVRRVLGAIESGRLQKAVLARFLDAHFEEPVDTLAALRFLRSDNERAHVFVFEPTPGRVFLGAAPEILAQLREGRFEATAVAGSIRRAVNHTEDEALSRHLLRSEKDLAEHRLTVDEMVEVLERRLVGMKVDPEPQVLRLAGIQHLETVIRGTITEGEDILSLVEAVHPTPAVCGRPREEALRVLASEEPFERGWYGGPVGWFDAGGEGDFVPALRSAVGAGRTWRLFAGAGIVRGSTADAEWEETELKLEPSLRALRAGAGIVPSSRRA